MFSASCFFPSTVCCLVSPAALFLFYWILSLPLSPPAYFHSVQQPSIAFTVAASVASTTSPAAYVASTASAAAYVASTASAASIAFTLVLHHNNSVHNPLFLLFYAIMCLCPFISSFSLALWLPSRLLQLPHHWLVCRCSFLCLIVLTRHVNS